MFISKVLCIIFQIVTSRENKCLICEFADVAQNQAKALEMMTGKTESEQSIQNDKLEPCFQGPNASGFERSLEIGSILMDEGTFCVAQFFIYEAQE